MHNPISPVTLTLCIHDPQESSWKVEWVKDVRTKHYGVMRVSLETHPTGVEDCSKCSAQNRQSPEKDSNGTALDAFLEYLIS
jgi:hypothetical protein